MAHRRKFSYILLAGILFLFAPAEGSARARVEHWIASSTNAVSITGDILLSPTRLQAAGHTFPLEVVADLPEFGGDFGSVPARVLAVKTPINPRLLNGNRFGCGKPIKWIAVWQFEDGRKLAIDTFTGGQMPTSVHYNDSLCGVYFYLRP